MSTEPTDDGPLNIVVNGSDREVEAGTTLIDLVAEVAGSGEARGVAAAVNGSVVPRGRWPSYLLTDGDRIEVLTAVQGG